MPVGSDLAVFTETACQRLNARQLSNAIDFFDANVLIAPNRDHAEAFYGLAHDKDIVVRGADHQPLFSDNHTQNLVYINTVDDFETLAKLEATDAFDSEAHTFVLSDLLPVPVTVSLTDLATELTGSDEYRTAINENDLTDNFTHLSFNATPSYRNDWDGLTVQGTTPGANDPKGHKRAEIAYLQLHTDGVVTSRVINARRFGIQALHRIDDKTAKELAAAGHNSITNIAKQSLDSLRTIDGMGEKTARTILAGAKATTNGRVYRTSDAEIPDTEPVFIDIGTDGPNPTMVWLIGVLDRASDDQYMSFLTTAPDDRGKSATQFMEWYSANATNRPIIAYNGEEFEFPVLANHINQYCPTYRDNWANACTFDPHMWAVNQNNAILPGRTNKLEDVSEALGWETDDTGITGSFVEYLLQQWLTTQSDETELDWPVHEVYCEDSVRRLARVYDAIHDANRLDGSVTGGMNSTRAKTGRVAQEAPNDF
jgi:hypothetical protein